MILHAGQLVQIVAGKYLLETGVVQHYFPAPLDPKAETYTVKVRGYPYAIPFHPYEIEPIGERAC